MNVGHVGIALQDGFGQFHVLPHRRNDVAVHANQAGQPARRPQHSLRSMVFMLIPVVMMVRMMMLSRRLRLTGGLNGRASAANQSLSKVRFDELPDELFAMPERKKR